MSRIAIRGQCSGISTLSFHPGLNHGPRRADKEAESQENFIVKSRKFYFNRKSAMRAD
jgi:hypothetical protein